MSMNIKSGWISEARKVISPNFDARPEGTKIDLLVVHGISLPPGEFGGHWIEDFFVNRLDVNAHPYFLEIRNLKLSPHLLVRRDGGLVQFVSMDNRAWHAGESTYCGRAGCNDYSIGIELEGTDEIEYTPEQYTQLAKVSAMLMKYYPLVTPKRIVGHCDIAPGRKTDPGPSFSFSHFRDELAAAQDKHPEFSPSAGVSSR